MMRLSRPPPLKNLRAFCAAARHRSFKFAADELCVTPSAVSHQMKELETALGMRLFERKTRALELTTAAHRLLDEVEPLLDALDRTLAQLARRNGRQTLRVRLPALFANELFIPRLADFCAAHPHIDVQLDTRDPRPAAHPPTADVSILLAGCGAAGMKSVRLFSSPLIAVCAREHAARVAQLGREVFGTLPLIVDRTRPFAWDSWADEVGLETPGAQAGHRARHHVGGGARRRARPGHRAGAGGAVRLLDAYRRAGARVRGAARPPPTPTTWSAGPRTPRSRRSRRSRAGRWRSTSVRERSSRIAPILFVCRPRCAFVSCRHTLCGRRA